MLHTFSLKGPTQSGRSTLLRGMFREAQRISGTGSSLILVPSRSHVANLSKVQPSIAYTTIGDLTIEAIRAATFIGIDLDYEYETVFAVVSIQEVRCLDVLRQLVVVSHSDWKSI